MKRMGERSIFDWKRGNQRSISEFISGCMFLNNGDAIKGVIRMYYIQSFESKNMFSRARLVPADWHQQTNTNYYRLVLNC